MTIEIVSRIDALNELQIISVVVVVHAISLLCCGHILSHVLSDRGVAVWIRISGQRVARGK